MLAILKGKQKAPSKGCLWLGEPSPKLSQIKDIGRYITIIAYICSGLVVRIYIYTDWAGSGWIPGMLAVA